MKRKLLTVLLSVVMVFGVFGMTACGAGENPDDSFNYYQHRYELEGEVKIVASKFFAVRKMFEYPGEFLLYIDNEEGSDTDVSARFQQINKLAQDWNVTIHHFNPNLSGGYADDNTSAHTTDITKDFTNTESADYDAVTAATDVADLQRDFIKLLGLEGTTTQAPNKVLVGIKGAEPTYSVPANYSIQFLPDADNNYEMCVVDNKGTADTSDDQVIFDMRLSTDATYTDIVNQYNPGASPAIMKLMQAEEVFNHSCVINALSGDPADSIRYLAFQKVSYGKEENLLSNGKVGPKGYNTSKIDTFNDWGDGRVHLYEDADVNHYTDKKTDVFETINFGQFEYMMEHNDGCFAVIFGGTWCHNVWSIARYTDQIAKDYGISKVYVLDPRLDGGYLKEQGIMNFVTDYDEDGNFAGMHLELAPRMCGYLYGNLLCRKGDGERFDYGMSAEVVYGDESTYNNGNKDAYAFHYMYAQFCDEYLDDVWSTYNLDKSKGGTYTIETNGQDKKYTKFAVPTMFLFNDGEYVAHIDAEYFWEQTYDKDAPETQEWIAGLKQLFDQNPYAKYLPDAQSVMADDGSSDSSDDGDDSDDEDTTPPSSGGLGTC